MYGSVPDLYSVRHCTPYVHADIAKIPHCKANRTPNLSIKRNSLNPSDTLAVFVDVVRVFDAVFFGVGFQPIYKGF